jgi:uridylate kinase
LKIVIRLGGSILGSPPDPVVAARYSDVISQVLKMGNQAIVVVGGGSTARHYIEAAKTLGLPHKEQDLIAIQASRLNARLFGMTLGLETVATTVSGALSAVQKRGVTVMGGLKPGITTDTVAALVAEDWSSDLIVKASDQKGIYTSDPRSDPNAKLLRKLSYARLSEILGGDHTPGIHSIVDPVAVRRIAGSKLKLVVFKGDRPQDLIRAIEGKTVGSTVG